MDDLHDHAAGEGLGGRIGDPFAGIVIGIQREVDDNLLETGLVGNGKGDLVEIGAFLHRRVGVELDLLAVVVKDTLRLFGRNGESHTVKLDICGGGAGGVDPPVILGGFLHEILKVALVEGDGLAGDTGIFDVVAVQHDRQRTGVGNAAGNTNGRDRGLAGVAKAAEGKCSLYGAAASRPTVCIGPKAIIAADAALLVVQRIIAGGQFKRNAVAACHISVDRIRNRAGRGNGNLQRAVIGAADTVNRCREIAGHCANTTSICIYRHTIGNIKRAGSCGRRTARGINRCPCAVRNAQQHIGNISACRTGGSVNRRGCNVCCRVGFIIAVLDRRQLGRRRVHGNGTGRCIRFFVISQRRFNDCSARLLAGYNAIGRNACDCIFRRCIFGSGSRNRLSRLVVLEHGRKIQRCADLYGAGSRGNFKRIAVALDRNGRCCPAKNFVASFCSYSDCGRSFFKSSNTGVLIISSNSRSNGSYGRLRRNKAIARNCLFTRIIGSLFAGRSQHSSLVFVITVKKQRIGGGGYANAILIADARAHNIACGSVRHAIDSGLRNTLHLDCFGSRRRIAKGRTRSALLLTAYIPFVGIHCIVKVNPFLFEGSCRCGILDGFSDISGRCAGNLRSAFCQYFARRRRLSAFAVRVCRHDDKAHCEHKRQHKG